MPELRIEDWGMIRHNRHGDTSVRPATMEKPLSAAKMETMPQKIMASPPAAARLDEQRRPQWFEGVKRVQQIVHAGEDTRRVVNVKWRRSQTVVITPGGESLRDSSMKT